MNVFLPDKIKNKVFINRFPIGFSAFHNTPILVFTGRKSYQKRIPDKQQRYPVFCCYFQSSGKYIVAQKNNIADSFIYLPQKSMDSLKQRRTIRKYQSKDISTDLLNDLLTKACRASTVGNMQTYSIIITRDAASKARLAPAHFNQPMVQSAPVVLTFCIDLRRFSQWCRQRKAEPGYNNFEWFVTGAIDTLLVAQTFCIAAEEEGLGICYLGTTTYNPQPIIDALKLPELVFPITTVTVGWPDENPAQTDRLPLEAIVHEEYYHDYTAADIDRLYAYKESLPENQRFIAENQKETLAQVFTEVRYTKKDSEAMSKELWKAMKQQGF